MLGMPKKQYRHVYREIDRHSNAVWYYRVGKGKRTRLKGEYDSPEFKKSYGEAVAGQATEEPAQRQTLGWLIEKYQESAAFKALNPSTQRVRINILKAFLKSGKDPATAPLKQITRSDIAEARDKRAATPFAAINLMKVLGYLFEFGVDAGYMKENPARGVKHPKVKTIGHRPWVDEDLFAYYAFHEAGSQARLAMDLLLFTGLRRSDVYRLGPQHVRGDMIEFRARKNDDIVYIPVQPEFRTILDNAPKKHMAYLVTPVHGRPFRSAAAFGNWFGEQCRLAGVDTRAHGLRKKLAQILAESGNSNAELKARFGWASDAMASLYVKEANKKKLAMSGAEKLNENEKFPHLKSGAGNTDDSGSNIKALKK